MRHILVTLLPGALLFALVASAANSGGKANVLLLSSGATLNATSNTAWSLAKTGTVNTTASTVSWTITATKGATTNGPLVVSGFISVTNLGFGGAPIGNIVVNLQTKNSLKTGSAWVTRSSDIADATHGDAATTAHVVAAASSEGLSTFTENAASGHLSFTDRKTNTAFSLVPEITIPALTSVPLLFSASFDNSVLDLAVGTETRAEVIVTFGNAAGGSNQTADDVDINGNGVIDPNEAVVRSVSTRIEKAVPAAQAANSSVTLSDTAASIVPMGTVTISNPTFTLGATTGTVTATYSAGASGGSITNCATATGTGISTTVGGFTFPIVAPVQLDACNTQTINAPVCTPGTAGCGWKNGDVISYGQIDWVSIAEPILDQHFNVVYAATGDVLDVGIPDPGFSMAFTSASAVEAYLPQEGNIGPLNADLENPTSSSSGVYGGNVVALRLNVDFSDAGFTLGTAPVRFGDLTMCNFSTLPALNGMTVRQFLAMNETLLGGGSATFTIDDVDYADPIIENLDSSFDANAAGVPSSFAQQQLFNGACPQ